MPTDKLSNYEKFQGEELITADRIQKLRLQLLVHSCLYYELDTNIIQDRQWDLWAKELVSIQAAYPKISEQVIWYEAFKDWDGSTGAFLPIKDPWVMHKAQQLKGLNNIVIKNKQKPDAIIKPKKPKGQLMLF